MASERLGSDGVLGCAMSAPGSDPKLSSRTVRVRFLRYCGLRLLDVSLSPVTGWADHDDRKQIMIATNIANGLTALLTFILLVSCSRRSPC
jgi:hypothetical protein